MKRRDAAKLAGAAYINKGFPTFECQGYKDVQLYEYKGTHCYMMEGPEVCVIAFRGTDDTRDWLTNLDIARVKTSYGKAHAGFNKSVDHIWPLVLPRILNQEKPFIIVGHSKGAAEAVIMTERLNMMNIIVLETHLFGCPRVGNYRYARNYRKYNFGESFRYVNNNDIVCRIPTPLRFKHVGKRVYINRSGVLRGYVGGLKMTWDRLRGRFENVFLDGIEDHDIWAYHDAKEK